MNNDVCIVGVARTPIGSLGGKLKNYSAIELGIVATKAAIERSKVPVDKIQEVFFGNVVSANLGQAPSKQVALGSGIPPSVPCTTINKVCASGMKAIEIGAMSIRSGINDVVVAGGFESMSNVPHYISSLRFGKKYGGADVVDGLSRDGLTDPYSREAMGTYAVLCAAEHDISRNEQDEYSARSYESARLAFEKKKLLNEVVSMKELDRDEEVFARPVTLETLQKLKPAFKLPHTHKTLQSPHVSSVTAGNSSTMSDGAAALILTSRQFAVANKLNILAIIRGWGNASQIPEKFTTSPKLATDNALKHAKLDIKDIDYFEINEAFAVVPIATSNLLGIDWRTKVNMYGGAVSVGHPLGCSGARITMTLLSVLQNEGGRYGVASICNGGGGASAIVLERPLTQSKL